MKQLMGLSGRNALIVGGGQGMGRSVALMLARAGCGSAIVDIDPVKAGQVAEEVAALGCKSEVIIADFTDEAQIAPAIERAQTTLGNLDVLVTIVGQALFKPALDVTRQEWDTEIQRNLGYVFFTAQAFARSLIQRGAPGSIVCIASVSGLQSAPLHAPYGAAKMGLVNLVRSLASEWADHGIRINAVAPGSIITPRQPASEVWEARTRAGPVPARRRGTTDEIGKAALFLCSDLASFVTGVTLPVDGGWMAANLAIHPHTWQGKPG
ncbi:MAG: SDR family NAD(P)-dependent oxidoreductase [Burkholderiaceae bacterium]|nr:SDR family NAD(P)-dependent oxidoreductase [Burkholderiaceae bacterium]